VLLRRSDGVRAGVGQAGLVALAGEIGGNHPGQRFLVVDDQDMRHWFGTFCTHTHSVPPWLLLSQLRTPVIGAS